LLGRAERERLRVAFASQMPLDDRVEPHLRDVLVDVLAHPGSLVRAQLAYGIARAHALAAHDAVALGIAVEDLHTASLLFDDLPMMDDATERRGRVCPHLRYGEAATTLAALALITRGYALIWRVIDATEAERRTAAARLVGDALGVHGILGGQARDLHFGVRPADTSDVVHAAAGKTIPLVRLSLVLPAVLGRAGAEAITALDDLAHAWGLAYQIIDDFKDRLMSRVETGKSERRDARLGRPNVPLHVGDGRARRRLDHLLARSGALVGRLTANADPAWTPLQRLQRALDAERQGVAVRLRVRTPAHAW
jgi:geranylgeranyl pyrophosphate synthase